MLAITDPTFSVLLRLHVRIVLRYVKRFNREIAATIILIEGIDILGANNIEQSFQSVVFMVYCSLSILLQLYRKDKKFLRTHVLHYKRFLILENVLLAIPFLAILIGYRDWKLVAICSTIALGISFVQFSPARFKGVKIGKFLPNRAFEWKAGIRQHLPGFVLLYGLGMFGYLSAAIPLFAIFMFSFTAASFYGACESYLIVDGFASRHKFLKHKLFDATKLFLLFTSPLLVLVLIKLSFVHWWVIGLVMCFSLLIVIGAVLIKYAHFDEGTVRPAQTDFRLMLLASSLAIVPITLYYELHLYSKAQRLLLHLDK